jgi:hypothetical protein
MNLEALGNGGPGRCAMTAMLKTEEVDTAVMRW